MKPDLAAERPAAPRPSGGYSDLSGKGQERACENASEDINGQRAGHGLVSPSATQQESMSHGLLLIVIQSPT